MNNDDILLKNDTSPLDDSAGISNPLSESLSDKDLYIKQLEQKVTDLEINWKRALADYQNYQKRVSEEKSEFAEFANATLLKKILPVLDNLENLQQHNKDLGFELTLKEFKKILDSMEVKEIDALNKDFDSNLMEGIELIDGEKNKVLQVVQKGFLFKNKVLRPCLVKVGKGDN